MFVELTEAQARAALKAFDLLAVEYEDCRCGDEPYPAQAPAKFWTTLEAARCRIRDAVLQPARVKRLVREGRPKKRTKASP
jgi:hypothetical protein